jgi:hypothetical protein
MDFLQNLRGTIARQQADDLRGWGRLAIAGEAKAPKHDPINNQATINTSSLARDTLF